MAQLLKLQDYVSRYEQNLTKYTNQFLRLKQQRWRDKKEQAVDLQKVRTEFLEEIYAYQLQWASSTLTEKSLPAVRYEEDKLLRLLLQHLPDSHLVFYHAVFQVENAPIELEAIVLAPTNIYCLAFLNGEDDDIYQASNERFWKVFRGEAETKVVSPFLSLKRSNNVLRRLTIDSLKLPIKQVILVPNGYVDQFQELPMIEWHDKRTIKEWQRKMASDPSPMKSQQLKIARLLLERVRTESYPRMEEEAPEFRQFPGE